jgi:hypothetical protein
MNEDEINKSKEGCHTYIAKDRMALRLMVVKTGLILVRKQEIILSS